MIKSILDDVLWRAILLVGIVLGTALFFWLSGFDWRSKNEKITQRQIDLLADQLDQQIEAGVYKEVEGVTESDAWGQAIRISYEQEGVGQRLVLCSAGKDGDYDTEDDLLASRWLLNATGIGTAASSYAGDVAREVAKGAVDGAKESVKESIKGRLGGLLKRDASDDKPNSEQQ